MLAVPEEAQVEELYAVPLGRKVVEFVELYAVPAEMDDWEPVPQTVLLGYFGVKLSVVLGCVGHMVVRGSQDVGWPHEVVPLVG